MTSTNCYLIFENDQSSESAVGTWPAADLSAVIAQANVLFPGGAWVIKDKFGTLVASWDSP